MKKNYFYGFKNIKTGLFAREYRTIRYKFKPAVFRTVLNAEKSLRLQPRKEDYMISEMVEIEPK